MGTTLYNSWKVLSRDSAQGKYVLKVLPLRNALSSSMESGTAGSGAELH